MFNFDIFEFDFLVVIDGVDSESILEEVWVVVFGKKGSIFEQMKIFGKMIFEEW